MAMKIGSDKKKIHAQGKKRTEMHIILVVNTCGISAGTVILN